MTDNTRIMPPFLALALGLALAACGEDGREESEAPIPSDEAPAVSDYASVQRVAYEEFGASSDSRRTEGGVYYKIIEEGSGESPTLGDYVTVHYEGRLNDGTIFDSSYARGAPANFPSDRLISGWQQILPLMRVGDKWEIAIPSGLAYGERGAGRDIPPHATLFFTMELLGIGSGS